MVDVITLKYDFEYDILEFYQVFRCSELLKKIKTGLLSVGFTIGWLLSKCPITGSSSSLPYLC